MMSLLLANVFAVDFARGVVRIALGWSALEQHGPFGLSAAVFAASLGQFLGSFVGGLVTDRFDRSMIVRDATWLGAIGFTLIGLLVDLGSALAVVCLLSAVTHLILAVQDNAARTMIPAIVSDDKFERANGQFIVVGEVGFFIAPIVAGWGTAHSGAFLVIYAAAGCCLLGALATFGLPSHKKSLSQSSERVEEHLSVAFLFRNQWLMLGVGMAVLANLLIVPINMVLVPIQVEAAGFTSIELGYFYAALSAGMTLGGMINTDRLNTVRDNLRLSAFLGAAASVYVVTYYFHYLPAILLCGLSAGFFLAKFEIGWSSIMQRRTPANLLGRTYAFGSWTSFAARASAVFLVGTFVSDRNSQHIIFILIAVLLTAMAFGALTVKTVVRR